jgi:hypothetical protein
MGEEFEKLFENLLKIPQSMEPNGYEFVRDVIAKKGWLGLTLRALNIGRKRASWMQIH